MYAAFDLLYRLFVPLLLVSVFVSGSTVKKESYNFLYVLNAVLPVAILFMLGLYAYEILMAWYSQTVYEIFVVTGRSPLPYYVDFILSCMGLLFFWRRFRTNRWYILVNLLVMTRYYWFRWIYDSSTHQQPSFWNKFADHGHSDIPVLLFVFLILVLLYLIQYKMHKLPHASLFLK